MEDDNRGPQLRAVCIAFLSIATVSVALRAFVRIRMLKIFGIEDGFMVAAWCCYIMFNTAAIAGVTYGTGRHALFLQPDEMMKAFRFWWICYIGYTTTMIAVKMSVGLTLLRFTVSKVHKRILYTIMSISCITGTIFLFLTVFQCKPVEYFWSRAIGSEGTCIPINIIENITYTYSAVNTITDFTFGILPVFMIIGLNMDTKTKIMLVPILSMACIASAAILVRMAYIREFADPDFLYATTDIAIWSCIEQGLAITAGSLATLRPLFRLLSQKLGLTTSLTEPQHAPQQPAGSRKRLSRPFGAVSFRHNDNVDSYHRMDDIASESSRANLSNKIDKDLEAASWSIDERESGRDRSGRLQIEKRIEIETRVDPAYD